MLVDRIILACTIVLALVYLYGTTLIPVLAIGDPLGPKAFPRLLGIIMLIAAALLALEMWRRRRRPAEDEPSSPIPFEWPVVQVLLCVTAWTGLYYFFFETLGFVLATFLYLLPLMAWFNRGKWIANIASSAGFVLIMYYVFLKLEVRLPAGVLPL